MTPNNITIPDLIRIIKDLDCGIDTNLLMDNNKYFTDDLT
jgi:hypothetical protein